MSGSGMLIGGSNRMQLLKNPAGRRTRPFFRPATWTARASSTSGSFVGPGAGAVRVAQVAEEREGLFRRDDSPGFPLDRLREDRGDAARGLRLVDEPLDFLDAGFRAFRGRKSLRVAVRVRVVREDHLPDERTEPVAVRFVLPGEADVEERAPVERGLEGDEPRPLRCGARNLDRVLDRLVAR